MSWGEALSLVNVGALIVAALTLGARFGRLEGVVSELSRQVAQLQNREG